MTAEFLWSFDRSESNAGFGKGSAKFSKVSGRFPAFSLFLALKVSTRPSCFFQSFRHSQALSNLSGICQSAEMEIRLWTVYIGLRCRMLKGQQAACCAHPVCSLGPYFEQ